jgi:hypothetical protein
LTHTGLFKALSKLWILSLIPQTRPTVSLALFNVKAAQRRQGSEEARTPLLL